VRVNIPAPKFGPNHPLAPSEPLTAERVAELLEQGVVLATLELLQEIEGRESTPVTLRSRRRNDGTWELIVTRYTPVSEYTRI
jgi:hypothetical protein